MLGTNELKDAYAQDIVSILSIIENKYIKIITTRKSQFSNTTPQLTLISPPPIDISKEYAQKRYGNIWDKVKELANWIKQLANKYNCSYILTSDLETWPDWVHLDEVSHKLLASKVSALIDTESETLR